VTDKRLASVMSRVVVTDGCWLWTGRKSNAGYAVLGHRQLDQKSIHRAMFDHFVGPLGEHMVIHHSCGVRHCVNPRHLVQVTLLEHRNMHPLRRILPKETCKRGHPLSGMNRQSNGRLGASRCRICVNERARLYYRRRNPGVKHAGEKVASG